jgi:hypothetical protein
MADRDRLPVGAAEGRDFVMHSRIGVLRALNRNVERTLTDRKETHWGRRKLKRDQKRQSSSTSTRASRLVMPIISRCSRTPTPRRHGSRKMTPKVWHSNMSSGGNWIGRRTILAMLLIVVLAILWNLLPR